MAVNCWVAPVEIAGLAGVTAMDTSVAAGGAVELKSLGNPQPRIAVCALNPHAGEDGLFGDEEQTTIAPAVASASRAGIRVTGPLPADSVFQRAIAGEFDGVVAMYHDQGHIALKLVGLRRAVNVTLGLPVPRTAEIAQKVLERWRHYAPNLTPDKTALAHPSQIGVERTPVLPSGGGVEVVVGRLSVADQVE